MLLFQKKYDGLRTQLLKKWEDITTGSGPGIWVTLRFPDGAKVKAFIDEDCTARVSSVNLYSLYNNCIHFYNTCILHM